MEKQMRRLTEHDAKNCLKNNQHRAIEGKNEFPRCGLS